MGVGVGIKDLRFGWGKRSPDATYLDVELSCMQQPPNISRVVLTERVESNVLLHIKNSFYLYLIGY